MIYVSIIFEFHSKRKSFKSSYYYVLTVIFFIEKSINLRKFVNKIFPHKYQFSCLSTAAIGTNFPLYPYLTKTDDFSTIDVKIKKFIQLLNEAELKLLVLVLVKYNFLLISFYKLL